MHGVPDRIIEQAPRARQLAQVGLDAAGIAQRVRALHETEAMAGMRIDAARRPAAVGIADGDARGGP